jgi:hypothetical protein
MQCLGIEGRDDYHLQSHLFHRIILRLHHVESEAMRWPGNDPTLDHTFETMIIPA